MTLLLDTHVLLWALASPASLSDKIRSEISNPRQTVFVSAVSVWEIGIKTALGKLDVPNDLEKVLMAS